MAVMGVSENARSTMDPGTASERQGICCKRPVAQPTHSFRRGLEPQAFSSVHCNGCWFCRAKSITWLTFVSATS